MRLSYKFIISIFSMITISACIPTKQEIALTKYQIAVEEKNLPQIIASLTELIQFESKRYKTDLNRFKKVNDELQNAKVHLENSNFYLAYLSIHNSFHNFPNPQSKEVLLTSGKTHLSILKAESALKQSSDTLPDNLQKNVIAYSETKITDWDLVKVNKLLEDINKSLKKLAKALTIIQKNNIGTYGNDFLEWQQSIKKQLEHVTLIKNHLINTALSKSTIALQRHNQVLITNTEDLLSLVRDNQAQEALQPIFFKAQQQYLPYLIANENLSLAGSFGKRNQHSTWYDAWHQLENETITLPTPTSKYIKHIESRIKKLNKYIRKEQQSTAALKLLLFNKKVLIPYTVQSLIIKLKKDKTLILYGKPSNK